MDSPPAAPPESPRWDAQTYNREYWKKNKKRILERKRAYYKAHRAEFNAKQRAYYRDHYAETARARSREYYRRNRERIRQQARDPRVRRVRDAYRARNAERLREKNRRWQRENRERFRELVRRSRQKLRERPAQRIADNFRHQLYRWVKRGAAKPASSETLLGCSFEVFRQHLECQFRKGMTWQNYGPTWHIDHIIPCSAFDLTQPAHVRQCFHFTNLRPLWAKANSRKRAKILDPQLKLLL